MRYLTIKLKKYFYLIISSFILLSCGDGVDIKDPQNDHTPSNNNSSFSSKELNFSSSIGWENLKKYYSNNSDLKLNTQYQLNSINDSIYHNINYKLNSIDFPQVTLNASSHTSNTDEKIIDMNTYTLWVNVFQLILDNPKLFPAKMKTQSINNQPYDTITFSRVPSYLILMLMNDFYFTDFKSNIKTTFISYLNDPSTLTVNEYTVATFILNDLTAIKSLICPADLNQQVLKKRKVFEDLYNHLFFRYGSIGNIFTSKELKTTSAKTTATLEIYSELEKASLFNEFSYIINEFTENKNSLLKYSHEYLIERSKYSTDKINYEPSNLYKLENDMFTTSLTIIKDSFVPVELKIESTYKGEYQPKLKLSVIQ